MKDSSQRVIIDLRQVLSRVIPWVSAKDFSRMILAQRPLRLPPGICAKRQPAPSLQVDGKCKSNLFLAQYKEEAMHAIRFPYLCYVLEGEIDMRLGIPSRQGNFNNAINSYQILTLPAQTFLFIPPGVFYPDGSPSYREGPPTSDTRLFWMHILPTGAFCHTSTVRNGKHTPDHLDIFVPSLQFAMLAEMLMDELQSLDKDALGVAQNALTLLLLRTRRGLSNGAQTAIGQTWKPAKKNPQLHPLGPYSPPSTENSVIVNHACDYIRTHIDRPLSIREVANYAYVSPSHLTRLFRAEMKSTVMKYVLEQRLEYAQSLLINSEISIEEIACFVGYQQPPQFNRAFKRIHRITPTEFRRRHRDSANLTTRAKK